MLTLFDHKKIKQYIFIQILHLILNVIYYISIVRLISQEKENNAPLNCFYFPLKKTRLSLKIKNCFCELN